MSRFLDGSLLILFFLVVNVLAAFITTGAATGDFESQCTSSQNVTTCENQGRESFFGAVADVTVGDFGTGTPVIVSVLWLLIGIFLLSVGVLLIVSSFIPLLAS